MSWHKEMSGIVFYQELENLPNFINSYVVEEALKERHLIAKGVSPGYIDRFRE